MLIFFYDRLKKFSQDIVQLDNYKIYWVTYNSSQNWYASTCCFASPVFEPYF